MRGSRNYSGSGPSGIYINSDNVFFCLVFVFSPQLILQKSKDYFRRKLSFSEVPGGGPTLSSVGGSNCLFLKETHITCNFPGGPDPILLYLEVHIFF